MASGNTTATPVAFTSACAASHDILVGAKLHFVQHHGNPWVFLVGGLAKHIACSSNGNPTRQTLKQLRQASWECTQLCKCINTEATPQTGRGPKPSPKNPPKPNILESYLEPLI